MRPVILTRPHPAADALPTQLAQHGITVYDWPTLQLSETHNPVIEAQLQHDWHSYSIIMCVSQHAARFAYHALQRLHLPLPPTTYLACVGQGTHDALRQLWPTHGPFIAPAPGDSQDSEGLWRALMAQTQIAQAPQKLLIIRAEQGRDLLRQLANEAGWQVDIWPCYRRMPLAWNETQRQIFARLQTQRPIVVVTSSEGLEALLSQFPPTQRDAWASFTWVTLHPRIAQYAHDCGLTDVRICLPAAFGENLIAWAQT